MAGISSALELTNSTARTVASSSSCSEERRVARSSTSSLPLSSSLPSLPSLPPAMSSQYCSASS